MGIIAAGVAAGGCLLTMAAWCCKGRRASGESLERAAELGRQKAEALNRRAQAVETIGIDMTSTTTTYPV